MSNNLRAQNASTLKHSSADRLDPADNFNRSNHRQKWLPFKFLLMLCWIAVAHSTQAGLVGHFKFNGNLNDETGNHNGALRDPLETTLFQPGKSGDALQIDSPGTSVECANPTTFTLSDNFTIAAWVKTTKGGEVLVVYKGPRASFAAKSRQFELYGGGGLGGNGIFFYTGDSGAYGTSFQTSHGITVNDDNWHHVAVTYSVTRTPHFTLYMDGIGKVGTDPGVFFGPDFVMQPDATDANQVLRIGGRDEGGGYTTFVGLMDDVQFYNQPLSGDQVKFLFNNPGEVVPPPLIPEITRQPQSQTLTIGPTVGAAAAFSVGADGQPPLFYQWQFNGANMTGETGATLALSVANTNRAGSYTVEVSNANGSVTSAVATLTVNWDSAPPTISSARTLGNANKVTVVFSEPVADPPGAASFAIDNGISVTGVARGNKTSTLELTTSAFTVGKTYTLTVKSGVKDVYGNEIVPNSPKAIELSVEVPMEYGLTVNGFQDDFSGATRDPNWVAVPAENDLLYVQSNGVLSITTMLFNPNHLLYEAPGYSTDVQEVLVRMRFKTLAVSGANAIVGVAVGANPDDAHPGAANNLLFLNTFPGGVEGPHVQFLNDYVAWGPSVPNFAPQFNTWYWLRLRQTGSTTTAGPNLFAKAWLADGTESEPADWQVTWGQGDRTGFAGIKGPSDNAETDVEVDYILIKAEGLPSTKVAPSAFSLVAPSTLEITQEPQDMSTPVRTRATFTVAASGQNLVYQWQQAPAGSADFTDIPGATSASYTTPQLVLSDNGNKYRCVVGALLAPSKVSREATLTVTEDVILPTLVSAKTLGNPNQVTVVLSEPVQDPVVSNFAIDNGITITGVTRGDDTKTILLATSAFSADKKYMLTVNGVKDRSGNEILLNSQIRIDLFIEVPVDFGQTVNGFQDDFTGAVRDPNWVAAPTDRDLYEQSDGVLKVPTIPGDPNKLLYQATGYDNAAQEVLARIKLNTFSAGGGSRAGVAVASDPEATHPGEGMNLLFIDFDFGDGAGPQQFRLLDDWRAWGPPLPNLRWQKNTWYWLRVRQTSSSSSGGANIGGKVWLADGIVAEPPDWQATWSRDGRIGFAGIQGPSGGTTDFEVDYVLIKAAGLPSIKVASSSFALVGPRIDEVPPTVVSAQRDLLDTTKVAVVFSEAVAPATATVAANYAINNGVTVSSAAMGQNNSTVVLTTSPITLGTAYTLTVNRVQDLAGNPVADNAQIAVQVPLPPRPQDSGPDGLVAIEAERYDRNLPAGGTTWTFSTEFPGFSGEGAMQALPNAARNVNIDISASPRMDYVVNFVKAGVHHVWVRGLGDSAPGPSADDSVNIGLDNQLPATSDRISTFPQGAGFVWSKSTAEGPTEPARFEITTPGNHLVTVWMREDGLIIDKLIITTNPDYSPTGLGPADTRPGPEPLRLGIARSGQEVMINWTGAGTLQSAEQVTGPWLDVTGATSPLTVTPSEKSRFYRVRQ